MDSGRARGLASRHEPSIDFSYGPRLIVGAGAAARLAELLPPGPCLFVTDAHLRALGLADIALGALEEAGIEPVIFDAVEADPSRDDLDGGGRVGLERGCASVVGFGGGSPMDVAKLAAYLIGSGDDLDDLWGVGKATGARLPLALVPTTAGTGSEATPVTIITVGGTEKRGVNSAALIADWAVLDAAADPGPARRRHRRDRDRRDGPRDRGLHLGARRKNPMSDLLAREALRLLSANLLRACDAPGDLEARSAMLLGAHLAGVAFANAPVAGVHALAYPLGGHFHVPHGLSTR